MPCAKIQLESSFEVSKSGFWFLDNPSNVSIMEVENRHLKK